MTASNPVVPQVADLPENRAERRRRAREGDDPDRLLTAQELAEWAQVPLRTVRQWAHRGGGPARIRIGKHVRYVWSDCLAWRDANRVD